MYTTKSLLNDLEQILNLLEGTATPCDYGCNDGEFYWAIQHARRYDPSKPIRVVDDWTWLDISYEEPERLKLTQKGLLPARIKAGGVLLDDTQMYEQDNWLISAHLVDFRENCIFESEDVTYVLANAGSRKTVTPQSLRFFGQS